MSSHYERSRRTGGWRRGDDLLFSSRRCAVASTPQHASPLPSFSSPVSSPQTHGREPHTTTALHPYPTLSLAVNSSPFRRFLPLSRGAPSPPSLDDPHRSLTPQRPSSSASTPLALSSPLPHRGRLSLLLSLYLCFPLAPSHSCFARPGALVGSPSTLPTRFSAAAVAAVR